MRRWILAVSLLAAACATSSGTRLFRSGTAALDRGDAAAAVHDLEAAARALPDSSAVRNHLGLAYAAAGRHDDALREFERAVAIDCDNRAAQTNLARARARARR
ncbi:MAG TPA: tetratricopeptide repeat protein [Myxococcota bacterium]|nr:tetratricopeptide repeat protein [Myxococcota bacterium]